MSNLIKVVAVHCEGVWYVIPSKMHKQFNKLLEKATEDNYDKQEEFNEKFGAYRTGGDLNNIQLYAEI